MNSKDTAIQRTIEGYIKTSGLTKKKIAANLGITVQTLIAHLEHPEKFNLGVFRRLCDMLRIPEEDREKFI